MSNNKKAICSLLSLRELIEFMPSLDHQYDYKSDFFISNNRLDGQLDTVPLLKGAVDALRYLRFVYLTKRP